MTIIPATPGWRVVLASAHPGEDPDIEIDILDVAAWKADNSMLWPMVRVDGWIAAIHEENIGAVLIVLQPSDLNPDMTELIKRARANYTLSEYLKRVTV